MKKINNDWQWTGEWSDDFLNGTVTGDTVRVPHGLKEVPLHYVDSDAYQMVSGYRKILHFERADEGKRHFLQFDGAGHIATVYFNGHEFPPHKCGYTAFRLEITDFVKYGEDNVVAVKLDSTENPAVPPFGFVIDYLTYGGLYRDVYLDSRPKLYIKDVFVKTPDLKHVEADVELDGEEGDETLNFTILNGEEALASASQKVSHPAVRMAYQDAHSWSLDSPRLYTFRTEIVKDGEVIDTRDVRFGFRTMRFDENSFYLNDEKVFVYGLNRHQCWPYVGYAVPEKLQREDARILKQELGVNAVRTSHYPQAQSFIDACDEYGLLVFIEIPGWQHVGDAAWIDQAVVNTEEMVLQYRNHPSIFVWGVRVNESKDNDEFYRRTNEAAHRLDPTRPTTGVRDLVNSSLLEDVYSYNDFSHNGTNKGCKPKKEVTRHVDHPLIITEAGGHMYPTKPYDSWAHREEHALRHGRVLNQAVSDGTHAGCFQWCMFDYPTHKDFGGGDRICYHGVMDSFRNPKMAAAVYASQAENSDVLEVGSPMNLGDYPAGFISDFYVFTNADEVRLFKNDEYVKTFIPQGWKGLKHGPVKIDDRIGDLIKNKENFEPEKAEVIRDCLNAATRYGLNTLPLKYKLKMLRASKKYGITYDEAYRLYGKYVGNLGGSIIEWRFEGWKDGRKVSEVRRTPSASLYIEATPSHTSLSEGDTWDMAAVRIQIKDGVGGIASYCSEPLTFTTDGPIELIGPATVCAEGGMTGTYVRTVGKTGEASLTISGNNVEPVTIKFTVTEA